MSTPQSPRPESALPCPVSKYITFCPTVPRLSDKAASEASFRMPRLMPNTLLEISVPEMDWKTRSTGVPDRITSIAFVTWASTQLCVGMW